MARKRSLVLAALLVVLGCLAPVRAQTTVSEAYRLAWDIDAPSLADAQEYDYRAIADGATAGIPLTSVQCAAASTPGAYACSAAFPAFTPGVEHTLIVTASNEAGVGLPSNAITFVFLVVPGQPRNLRPVRP